MIRSQKAFQLRRFSLTSRLFLSQEGFVHDSNWTKYVVSLYWAFSTLCTVGYGDVVPSTTGERLFAIGAMLVGATIFAYFMGKRRQV